MEVDAEVNTRIKRMMKEEEDEERLLEEVQKKVARVEKQRVAKEKWMEGQTQRQVQELVWRTSP